MIDRNTVEKVMKLARIRVPDAEIPALARELAAIVDYVEKIRELDLTDVPPLSHGGDATNVFRDDVVRPSLSEAAALANAPDRAGAYFRVPRVIAEA